MKLKSLSVAAALLLAVGGAAAAQTTPATATPVPADSPVNAAYAARPAWLPPTEPGKGMLVIYRPKAFYGWALTFKFYSDDKVVGKLKNGGWFYAQLEPGDHLIATDNKKHKDGRLLEVEAGKTYYFVGTISPPGFVSRATADLQPVDEGQALSVIPSLKK